MPFYKEAPASTTPQQIPPFSLDAHEVAFKKLFGCGTFGNPAYSAAEIIACILSVEVKSNSVSSSRSGAAVPAPEVIARLKQNV